MQDTKSMPLERRLQRILAAREKAEGLIAMDVIVLCRCEDDLTHKLAEIIRHNNTLRKAEENGAPQHIIRQYVEVLQHDVATYIDNTKPGIPVSQQRSGRAIKSISQRLKVGCFSSYA